MISILTQDKQRVVDCRCIMYNQLNKLELIEVDISDSITSLGTYSNSKITKSIFEDICFIIRHKEPAFYEMPEFR